MSVLPRLLASSCVIIAFAPTATLADNASDIQALKEQVRAMQQKIDQLSAPQTTGTVPALRPPIRERRRPMSASVERYRH